MPSSHSEDAHVYHGESAASVGLTSCHDCAKLQPLTNEYCTDCGSDIHARKEKSVEKTLAYTIASVVLYIPANILPIMTVTGIGGAEQNTIIGGVITFWKMQAYPVAIVIFTASVLIPILKIIAIFALCWAATHPVKNLKRMTKIYRVTELVGRWSMVDVFVVAILVTLVQMGQLMSISPGPAALAFGGVVVLTMIGAHCFDPRLMWDRGRESTALDTKTL